MKKNVAWNSVNLQQKDLTFRRRHRRRRRGVTLRNGLNLSLFTQIVSKL